MDHRVMKEFIEEFYDIGLLNLGTCLLASTTLLTSLKSWISRIVLHYLYYGHKSVIKSGIFVSYDLFT